MPAPNPYPVPPPTAPKRTGRTVGIIIGVVVLLGVLCVGGLVAANVLGKNSPANAKVGDCLAGDSMNSTTAQKVNNVKIVDCTSADAKYKVVGLVGNKTETDFESDQNICQAFPTAQFGLWQGNSGEAGSVLCLEPKG
jgi:hypothetical protein